MSKAPALTTLAIQMLYCQVQLSLPMWCGRFLVRSQLISGSKVHRAVPRIICAYAVRCSTSLRRHLIPVTIGHANANGAISKVTLAFRLDVSLPPLNVTCSQKGISSRFLHLRSCFLLIRRILGVFLGAQRLEGSRRQVLLDLHHHHETDISSVSISVTKHPDQYGPLLCIVRTTHQLSGWSQ